MRIKSRTVTASKLAKDIHVPARQNFNVTINFFPFSVLGAGQGGTIPSAVSPLDFLNQFDGIKLLQLHIDFSRVANDNVEGEALLAQAA